jgi:quercetin dioxygenase-like cupin family protein
MTVVHSSDLDFRNLPGRSSADPFHDLDPGSLAVRVVIIEEHTGRTPHLHPHSPEIIYVAEGRGTAWQNRMETRVAAGDIIRIPQNVAHATIPEAGSRLKLICFFPRGDLSTNLVELEGTISIDEERR